MDKKISIRQFPSAEHPYISFPQKYLAVLDISMFTSEEIALAAKQTRELIE